MDHLKIGAYMTDKEFNKRCLEDYSEHICKGCRYSEIIRNTSYSCKQFNLLEVEEEDTCKLWRAKDD